MAEYIDPITGLPTQTWFAYNGFNPSTPQGEGHPPPQFTIQDLPKVIVCTQASRRGPTQISLTCEDSIHSEIDLYRGFEKDYDKYSYVRADIHRVEMVRVHDQANELIKLSMENTKLKEEVIELRHLLDNN